MLGRPPAPRAPSVSVIIPTFNRARLLQESVSSVVRQSHKDWELLIVDDGSTDGTEAAVRPLLEDPRIRYLKRPNGGVSRARNAGIKETSAPWVAFLDSDDVWLPSKLERQMADLEAAPGAVMGITHCAAVGADGGLVEEFRPTGEAALERLILGANVFPGAASSALVRRTALEAAGGFDEELQFSADWDMWIRLAAQGAVCVTPEILVRYRLSGPAPAWPARMVEHDFRRVYQKVQEMPGVPRRLKTRRVPVRGLLSVANYYRRKREHAAALRVFVECTLRSPIRSARGLWRFLTRSPRASATRTEWAPGPRADPSFPR